VSIYSRKYVKSPIGQLENMSVSNCSRVWQEWPT